jgi:signal transduction histidine kinase
MFFYLLYKLVFLTAFMCLLIQFKYGVKKSAVIVGAFSLLIFILNYLIAVFFGAAVLGKVFLLTATVPAFFGFLAVSRSSVSKVLFSLLTSIFSMLARFIGLLPNIYWNRPLLGVLFEIVADVLLIYLIVRFFRKPYLRMFDTLEKGWGYLSLVPGLLLGLLFYLMYYHAPLEERPENIPAVSIASVLSIVFYLILYLNFENISQYYELKQDRQITVMQLEMHKKEFETLQESIHAMKIYRHDMKHWLSAVNTLLSDGNAAEAQKLIRRLDGNLDSSVLERHCENYIVNVVLSSYIKKAQDERIAVSCEATVPDKTHIDPVEIGLVFANAIENAMNACRMISDADRRKISVICREQNGQLMIRISNPYMGEVRFDGEFPMAGDPEHGTGTKSIAAIARKNDGAFSFAARDGIFNMTVSFKY